MKTWSAKAEEVERKWWVVDATNQTLGRLATRVARKLRGKDKPIFTPHVDTGDFVVVINSDKIKLSGNKWGEKTYYSHSRYFGSTKAATAENLKAKDPCKIVVEAVKGMLPKNSLGRKLNTKLKVYVGPEHPHQAQKPEALVVE